MAKLNVVIEHRDGRTYSVTEGDYRKVYASEGFRITGHDGTPDGEFVPYEAPKPAAEPAAAAGDEGKGKK